MRISGRGAPAIVVALALAVSGAAACSDGGGSVQGFCTSVKQNAASMSEHAVGVGVDNQKIMENHVTAYETVSKKAPSDIEKQTSYIASKQKVFLEAWRKGGFKTNTMPDFDPGLTDRYKAVGTFVFDNCGVTIT